ncbi:hypothetical protein FQZ97_958340 [compost metagenome]
MFGFFDAIVVRPVEVALEQVVARIALVLHHADHAPHRHTHQRQCVAGQHQAGLDGFGHHLGGAGAAQLLQSRVIDGAHHHRHLGRLFVGVVQHLERAGRLDVGDHHRAGAVQAGGDQGLQARGIAEDDRIPGGSGLAHAVGIQIERHVGNAFGLQQPRQVLAAASVAADDHVLVGVD